eukprot:scaffold40209_cov60-Attheya_sp.AAC.1
MVPPSPYFVSTDAAGTTVEFTFPNSSSNAPRFGLGYWSIRGLGAPLTMMLCAAQQPFTLFLYDILENGDGWTSPYFSAKSTYIKDYKAPLWNLPFCADRTEGRVICQTNAVFAHVARACGFMGDDDTTMSQCEEFLSELYDLRNIMTTFAYGGPVGDEDEKLAKNSLAEATKHFKKLEAWLEIQATSLRDRENAKVQKVDVVHLVNGKMSAPDFHLWEMLDQYQGFCDFYKLDNLFEELPRLKAFKDGFAALPENQFYLKSWLHTELPYNNCMARFGSLPGPKSYEHGKSASLATWRKKGTIAMSPHTSLN